MAMCSLVNGTFSFSSGHNRINWICMGSIRKINCFVDFTHMTHYAALRNEKQLGAFDQANVHILLCLQHEAFVIVGPQAWNNKKKGREKRPNILLSAIRLAPLSLPLARFRSAELYLACVCVSFSVGVVVSIVFHTDGRTKENTNAPKETFSFFRNFSRSLLISLTPF